MGCAARGEDKEFKLKMIFCWCWVWTLCVYMSEKVSE